MTNYLVDDAGDADNEEVLVYAIELSDIIESKASLSDACLVRYHRSNAWAALRSIRKTGEDVWSWEQPELLKQIYWLRGAVQHLGHADLPAARRAQIYCNLGNALSQAGRFVDALVEWRNALKEQPIHGMARGNLGIGLVSYGMFLYDEGHTFWFLREARKELNDAIEVGIGRDGATYPEALLGFNRYLEFVEQQLAQYERLNEETHSDFLLGDSDPEQQYRQWCLEKNLFLNPLNDLYANPVAAQDVLLLPSHRIEGAGITYRAFFNQLKQEFIYARWSLFDGINAKRLHFGDREVFLESNADLALYSIGLEKVKTAFRCAYSLLDKVAYFVNAYWKLGIPEKRVSFRTLWFEDGKGKQPRQVRQIFEISKNFPLRGLFWIAKDIYEDDLQTVASPTAKEMDALRNHLEHKFVKVVDVDTKVDFRSDMFEDKLSHQVVRDDLISRSEYLVMLSRSALIYLSLAMHVEERRVFLSEESIMPFDLGIYPDDLKI